MISNTVTLDRNHLFGVKLAGGCLNQFFGVKLAEG